MKHSLPDTDLTVSTAAGAVRGTEIGAGAGGGDRAGADGGVRTWRGIPYAAPPVGPLRFRGPQPVAPWTSVRAATRFGDAPPQLVRSRNVGAGRHPVSEDCLTINVTAPAKPGPEPLPVIVCLYGGGFLIGSSAAPVYGGGRLVAAGDVVYVSLNYRVGALGFLDLTSYADESHPFESNVGLRDQLAGLRWVRDNIAAFGGDPDNVTLLGQSAGGTSVLTLMAVPPAAGLFHRAVALSPAPASVYGSERHAAWARTFVRTLGIDDEDAARALTHLPWRELVGALDKLSPWLGRAVNRDPMPASPVVDGDFLPRRVIDAFQTGAAHRVPLIVGSTAREGALFRYLNALPTSPQRIEQSILQSEPDAWDRIRAGYPRFPRRDAVIDMVGDGIFWHPGVQIAQAHSRFAPVWSYRYDFDTPALRLAGLGATHGTDLPALFGELETDTGRFFTLLGGREEAARLSARYQGALLDFARHGDPGGGWPTYDDVARRVRIFDTEDRIESDPRRGRRLAWGDYRGFL